MDKNRIALACVGGVLVGTAGALIQYNDFVSPV